jgi:hypothetical protein
VVWVVDGEEVEEWDVEWGGSSAMVLVVVMVVVDIDQQRKL